MKPVFVGAVVSLLVLLGGQSGAYSAEYPTRPIRIVVTFPAGGAVDVLTRIVAEKLSSSLGHPMVVDARPGASGVIATDIVAKANPNGYTILSAAVSHAINPFVYTKLPYDTEKDFVPIALMVVSPNVVAVTPSLPVSSIKDLIALAKSKPGQMNYASAGIGSNSHLSAEMFKSMAGVALVHIPYKGGPQALTDVVMGAAQVVMQSLPVTMPFLKGGRLKAVAVTSAMRSSLLREIPAVAEAVPGYEATSWYGLVAPKGTPPAVIVRLSDEVGKVLDRPDVIEALSKQSAEPTFKNSAQFNAFIKSELSRWGKAVKEAGLKPGSL